ncbi:hypothetical protein JYU34_000620 [Plutella xylostella]|uniref:Uncharacterized protein n=1 Tax=Plutella xylostella TaxID=51655 RepID=A0ABQ7R865_PLUXY|nr:hypothetical protein JYU34_000620 [Plutella xylostella]
MRVKRVVVECVWWVRLARRRRRRAGACCGRESGAAAAAGGGVGGGVRARAVDEPDAEGSTEPRGALLALRAPRPPRPLPAHEAARSLMRHTANGHDALASCPATLSIARHVNFSVKKVERTHTP